MNKKMNSHLVQSLHIPPIKIVAMSRICECTAHMYRGICAIKIVSPVSVASIVEIPSNNVIKHTSGNNTYNINNTQHCLYQHAAPSV